MIYIYRYRLGDGTTFFAVNELVGDAIVASYEERRRRPITVVDKTAIPVVESVEAWWSPAG